MTDIPLKDDRKYRSLWGDVWSQFRTHKGAMVGTVVFFSILIAVAIDIGCKDGPCPICQGGDNLLRAERCRKQQPRLERFE